MSEKTIIVTGGNAGIGKAIALSLAQQGYRVVIVSRDPQKGEAALTDIRSTRNNESTELVIGNLDSIESTKKLAHTLIEKYPQTSGLINNAGVWMDKKVLNEDGLEYSFMVNHMAPFLLSNLLLPILKANVPARIVNVNAGLYIKGKLDLDKTPYGKDFGRIATYMNTKLCNAMFTREFARAISGSGVTINAVHPGVIRTGLGDTTGLIGSLLRLVKRSWDTPEAGAEAPVWLATAPELEGINGKYYVVKDETEYEGMVLDETLAWQLCQLSSQLSGVNMP